MKSSYFLRLGGLGLLLASLFSNAVLAQSPAQAIERLEAKQQQLRSREEALRGQSQSISSAMANAELTDGPEKAAYDEAAASFEEASEQYEKDPNATNKSRVRNAEFKLHLAERKYHSGNAELRKLEEQQDEVESQLIAVRRELDDIDEQIPQLHQRMEQQREREQAQAAARAREKAAQAAQANNGVTASGKAQSTQPANAPAKPEERNNSSEQGTDKPAEALAKRNTSNPIKPAPTGDPVELDRDFTLLTSKAQVLTALANLQLRVGGDTLKIRSNKILNVRHFVDGKEVDKNSLRFKGLGNYQYRADAQLPPGENRLRVSFSRWNIDMPADYGNEDLVILMDASDRNAPKIVCFPARLAEES